MEQNRRRYFRCEFKAHPICAKLRLFSINKKEVESNYAYACIYDMGAGGLRFESSLDFPIRNDVFLQFNMVLSGKELELIGYIVRKEKKDNGYYEYGVEFVNQQNDNLFSLLNQLSVQLRKSYVHSGCEFCSLKTSCFKKDYEKKNAIDKQPIS